MSRDRNSKPILPILVGGVVLGAPIVMVVWHNLSELLAGRPHTRGLLVSSGLLVLLFLLTRALARALGRLPTGP